MKKIVKTAGLLTVLMSSTTLLHAEVDEGFVQKNSTVNESFIRSIARNRAHVGDKDAIFVEIDGEDEFKEKLESGELNRGIQEGNGITKQYIYKDIKNVNITDRDLNGIDGNQLNLGTQIQGDNQQVVQILNITDSQIDTDKEINAGISSDSSSLSGITNVTTIKNSSLMGGNED
jgi:hypothetical protein